MFSRRLTHGVVLVFAGLFGTGSAAQAAEKLKLLFLGDNGHHQPPARFRQLQPVLRERGIDVTYTDQVTDLNPRTLGAYDGLMIYANTTKIDEAEEKALIEYVESGKGFIPLHCASYCFLNSQKYIDLVGAQFQKHGTGTFRVANARPEHPVMKGYGGFESWDETYTHTKHNDKDRTVLEYRAEANGREPWTWVRTQGKGRVFYTAWGHDDRTWSNPGFQNLVERGIRWATGREVSVVADFSDKVQMTAKRTDVKPFEYQEATVPFYPPNEKWGTQREPLKTMQKPLDVAESMKHFVTPVGFEVRLFASDKDFGGKPICLNWDERGRLWVAVTIDYPNEKQPEGRGRDKIMICEDTNGDGQADKFTTFADKLSIPTSLIFSRGGIIVTQAPETLYLRDTNGDDKADERVVLFTGWSTGDTHAGPSNLHYGIDNWIYGMLGYAGFEGTIAGEKMSFRTGFFRLSAGPKSEQPKAGATVRKFEFLRNTNNNSWGIGVSEDGILFGSTANGNPSEYMPIANRYYEGVRGWSATALRGIAGSPPFTAITDKIRQVDHHGKFTAAAGHALYTARNYPRQYWDKTAFVAEPTGHLVATFQIEAVGADYRSRVGWNLLASDDEWSSPTMAEVGPDGNVWVIDWYNYIVQHNPTPAGFKTGKGAAYETSLRDKEHGRIYRLVYTGKDGKPECQPPNLVSDDPIDLASALRHENMFWRLHAQRLLVERGKLDILPLLLEMARDTSVDSQNKNTSVVHALWTMHGLGAFDGKHPNAEAIAVACLKHPAPGVRRAAVQVLPRSETGLQALLSSGIAADGNPQVHLAALLSLSEMPSSATAGAVAAQQMATVKDDPWLLDAATAAAARHDLHFLKALTQSKGTLSSAELERITIVANHLGRGVPGEKVAELLTTLAALPAPAAQAALAGLEKGWPKSGKIKLTPADEEAIAKLLATAPKAARGALVNLATRWGSAKLASQTAEIAKGLLVTAQDEKASDADRAAAVLQLIEFQPANGEAAVTLLRLINVRTSPQLATAILDAVSRSEAPEVGGAIVEMFPKMTPNNKTMAFRVLLSRGEWTMVLLDSAAAGKLPLDGLSLDQKQALAAHPNKKIAAQAKTVLAKAGGLPDADRQKVIDALLPEFSKPGDPVAGKQIYIKQCAKCHIHNGEGTKIGPDLTGMAVHPKHELAIHVLDPSRNVEGNYRVYVVATDDGRVYNGLLASETKTSIELIDAEAKRQVIQRENIEEFVPSNKSLMPEGFEKQVTVAELNHVLEFLTQRGKYLPIPIDKVATVVTTKGMFFEPEGTTERLIFADWKPKTFEGVPFILVDPNGDRSNNAVMLYGPNGKTAPLMPKSVRVPCNTSAKTIHLLSGIAGWGYPATSKGTVSVIVRLHYDNARTEDIPLRNGEHFADYIRRVDVPDSKFAFALRGQQLRYLSVQPKRAETIKEIEFVKGPDNTAPIIMAVTVETLDKPKE